MSFYFFLVLSVTLLHPSNAGGYMEQSRPQQATTNTKNTPRTVPTLSYDYQLSNSRQRHLVNKKLEPPQGSYYSGLPKVQVPKFEAKPSIIDTVASLERRNSVPSTGVYRTYGKGQVKIPHRGATVQVPRTFGSSRAYKAMVSTKVIDPPKNIELDGNSVITRSRRDCAGCPKDEMVVASRGNNYVILPEPCSYKWQTITGPKPGTKITEGIHYITGTMGHRKKVCQFKYQVVVRKCPAIEVTNINVTCSADNAWGSECHFSCFPKYELKGISRTECGDDYLWMDILPKCVVNHNCLLPEIENGTKINCETNELTDISNEYLPEGAYCRLKNNGMDNAMKCRRGEWKKVTHNKNKHRRNKHIKKVRHVVHEERGCKSDTCFNGGTCIDINEYNTFVCICNPPNTGARCEAQI